MKTFAALLIAASVYAADPPKPKQLTLEEGNILLQMRNQYANLLIEITRMESQIMAQESALKAKYQIGQSCRIASDGRSFVVVVNEGNRETTQPCPDAQPKPEPKQEEKK